MYIAKADDKDFELAREFKHACEGIWGRNYSLRADHNCWEDDWDNEDEDYLYLMSIKKRMAKEEGIDIEEVDNRIVIYEWLRKKFKAAEGSMGRVVMAADCLITSVCDPMQDILAFHPGFEFYHVAAEQ